MDVQTILPKALELNKMNWIRRLFNEKIKVKITSSKKKVLYSFRHTIASELKYLNVKSEIISGILGHTAYIGELGHLNRKHLDSLFKNIF